MAFFGLGFIACAAVYFWPAVDSIKIASNAPATPNEQPPLPTRGPTLEATRNSTIDAQGAVIPGDLPFQFGRADDHSVIDMAGINVTRKGDGTIAITPGAVPVTKVFPPPTGEFSALSNEELKARAKALSGDLREFQRRFDEDGRKLKRNEKGRVDHEVFKAFADAYTDEYKARFPAAELSMASEFLSRLKTVTPTTSSEKEGAQMILYGLSAGPTFASDAAAFVDLLERQLPAS